MTVEQLCVVQARIKSGYEKVGLTKSTLNGLLATIVCKGKHVMVINSLGYGEYSGGVIVLEDV